MERKKRKVKKMEKGRHWKGRKRTCMYVCIYIYAQGTGAFAYMAKAPSCAYIFG